MCQRLQPSYSQKATRIFSNIPQLEAYLSTRPALFEIVLLMSIVLVVLIVVTFAYLVFARLQYLRKKHRESKVLEVWNPIFKAVRAGDQPHTPKLGQRDGEIVLEFWLEQRSLHNNSHATEFDEFGYRIKLDKIICNVLKKKSYRFLQRPIWLQNIAIAASEWIYTDRTLKYLKLLLESNNRILAVGACACLARLKAEGYERDVVRILFRFPEEALFITSELGAAGGADILHVLRPFLGKLPTYAVMNFIALVEASKDPTLLPIIEDRLQEATNDEEIAALIRSIGNLGDSTHKHLIIPYLSSSNRFLCVQAAKALGEIGEESDVNLLLPFLNAKEWWLRYRVAGAIVKLCQNDRETIERMITSMDDRFAVDILRHVSDEFSWCAT